ncbi:DsrE family protein [Tibeticola sp.]|uniref:DsrE family protein n=1 Tax=Tibeticola sp. TaxID=2005368 RepID=UPI0025F6CE03|nr:DsrE family protein [Tibeticola sp.]
MSIRSPSGLRRARLRTAAWVMAASLLAAGGVQAQAQRVQTPYAKPKVIFDLYLDHPDKMATALYWVRSFVNPLTEAPYSFFDEDMKIVVLLHGTELVTVARKNEERYAEVVQRMRYYAERGVQFRVCGLALTDYGYTAEELQPFIEVAPSAMTELVHWQNQGYALVTPQVVDKKLSIESIR